MVSFVGSAKGTNTATAPAHQAGDLMLVVTTRNASATAPTLVSGFTNLGTNTANTYSIRAAFKICTSTSDATGTWTNATECIVAIYRPTTGNVANVGQFTFTAGSSTTVTYTGFTLADATSGLSWIAAFGGTKTASVGVNGAITGFTQRQDEVGTGELVGSDTNGGVTTFTSKTQTITTSAWKTFCCEILDQPTTGLTNVYQHVAGGGNPFSRGNTGTAYKIPMPNPSGAGNCFVLAITYDGGATVSSVADNINGTWGAASITTAAGAGNLDSKLYIFPNISTGLSTVTVTFSAAVTVFQYCISELYNIDATPSAGTTSRTNVTTQNANSFTPTNNNATGGNLIWYYACKAIQVPAGNATNFVTGPSMKIMNTDTAWNNANDSIPKIVQQFVQTTAAAFTPAFTSCADAADPWNSLAIALKINTGQGTAPSTTLIGIKNISHFATEHFPASGTYSLEVAAEGNCRVICSDDPSLNTLTVTDNEGNTWSAGTSGSGFWYLPNSKPNPNLVVYITGGGSDITLSWRFIDVINSDPNPFNAGGSVTSLQTVNGLSSFTANTPSVPTPTITTGLMIANIGLGQGPGLAVTAPTTPSPGAIWDLCTYTGETDLDLIENADITAHYRFTASGAQTWTFTITTQVSNSTSGGFICLKEATAATGCIPTRAMIGVGCSLLGADAIAKNEIQTRRRMMTGRWRSRWP